MKRQYHPNFKKDVPSILEMLPGYQLLKQIPGISKLDNVHLTPYFAEAFNWADFVSMFILIPLLIINQISNYANASAVFHQYFAGNEVDLNDVWHLNTYHSNVVYILATVNFISWLKLFDYLRVFPSVGKY